MYLQEKKKKQERKKSILYLIENFLRFEGYELYSSINFIVYTDTRVPVVM